MAIVDASQAAREVIRLQSETASAGLTINLFWIIVAALKATRAGGQAGIPARRTVEAFLRKHR